MACRWRIRHKLMIGVGLVIIGIGLLLGGTFKGLLSYQATMRTIDSKLMELVEAHKLRDCIKRLTETHKKPRTQAADLFANLGKTREACPIRSLFAKEY